MYKDEKANIDKFQRIFFNNMDLGKYTITQNNSNSEKNGISSKKTLSPNTSAVRIY